MVCITVIGCSKKCERNKDVSFYRIRTVVFGRSQSRPRREDYLAAFSRADLTASIFENGRICSQLFLSSKPASLFDETSAKWLGHDAGVGYRSSFVWQPEAPGLDCQLWEAQKLCFKSRPGHLVARGLWYYPWYYKNFSLSLTTVNCTLSILHQICSIQCSVNVKSFQLINESSSVE